VAANQTRQSCGCLFLLVLFFLVCGILPSGQEWYWLIFGHETQAVVDRVHDAAKGIGDPNKKYISYSYTEPDGTQGAGFDSVPDDWPIPSVGSTIPIHYIPGGGSRVQRIRWFQFIPTAVCLVFLIRIAIRINWNKGQVAQDEKSPEPTEFNDIIEPGFNVIIEPGFDAADLASIIKTLREITGWSLMDCKIAVEAAPKAVKENVDKKTSEDLKKKLEDAGAKVTVKPAD
jgi:ribosomal protein L7/L12